MIIIKVDFDTFKKVTNENKFLNLDKKEMFDFGYSNINNICTGSKSRFNEYYIISDDNNVNYGVVCIDLCSNISIFFFDNVNKYNIKKILYALRTEMLRSCSKVFFINVANWYKAGIRNLKYIGFKPYKHEEFKSIWFYEKR